MMWVKLAERYPPRFKFVPNDNCRCECCEETFHEVSDFVLLLTSRNEVYEARWNFTTGMWETHGDFIVMDFVYWRPKLALPNEGEKELIITYSNWKGEIGVRRIKPVDVFFGSNEWHPEPQWLMLAFDVDKNDYRTFAMLGIIRINAQSSE